MLRLVFDVYINYCLIHSSLVFTNKSNSFYVYEFTDIIHPYA